MAGPWQPGEFDSGKLELLCSMLSVMCSQERLRVCGGEQARLLPARCRPSGPTHKGEGHVKRHVEKKRKRKTETRAGLQIGRGFFLFWARLTVAFPCFCLRCGEPLLSHSPHLTWLSFLSLSLFLTPLS